MRNLTEAFRVLKAAGCKLAPVPGTKWYEISGPDGWAVLVKEKDIVGVLGTTDPEQIKERLRKADLVTASTPYS
ncbi:MAG: hypothetical protein C4570_06320 [Ammonifex sp.]|jgi:hypothetical protein|nr:MAG: hypothetical protein C4570_06320 [Ammonifex sp.]